MNRDYCVNIIQKMPLNTNETKALLLNIFRMTLAVSEKRTDDAIQSFSVILDSVILPNINGALGDISSIDNVDDGINLVIQEVQEPDVPATTSTSGGMPNAGPYNFTAQTNDVDTEDDNVSTVETETSDEEEEEVASEEEVVASEAVVEEEEEELVEEEEEEEVELNLEPVRIKKILYWKDIDTGDLYTYLPDDEVGDKIGSYVDGKPVFD